MSAPGIGLADLQAKIAKHAWEDPAFEAEFMTNPKGTFEKYTGQPLPAALAIHAHYNTPTDLHFVLPKRAETSSDELTDDELESVAGGEIVSVAIALSVAVSVSMAVTFKEEGW